jgi:hypothetical protein
MTWEHVTGGMRAAAPSQSMVPFFPAAAVFVLLISLDGVFVCVCVYIQCTQVCVCIQCTHTHTRTLARSHTHAHNQRLLSKCTGAAHWRCGGPVLGGGNSGAPAGRRGRGPRTSCPCCFRSGCVGERCETEGGWEQERAASAAAGGWGRGDAICQKGAQRVTSGVGNAAPPAHTHRSFLVRGCTSVEVRTWATYIVT